MYSFQPAQASTSPHAAPERVFQRVAVGMAGRLMLESHEEYSCTVVEMSPGDVVFGCDARPAAHERVVAYIENLGRIEGNVVGVTADGFSMSINATDRKREKLAAQLTWLANKHELGLPEDRRHDRLTPRVTRTEIVLDDGRRYPCKIVDLSLSGAAVDIEIRPALGTAVMLGAMRGRIVRHFVEGVAIEFASVQTRESLRAFL